VTEIAIDTASDIAGVAVSLEGVLVAEVTWQARMSHSRELLPTLDWLLARTRKTKADIGSIFVCIGPGSYAGLRVGLSTAKALAYALSLPIVGVGRLAADAEPYAALNGALVHAVHTAGRAEVALAAYRREAGGLSEVQPPRLLKRDLLVEAVPPEAVVCGELDEGTRLALSERGFQVMPSTPARVTAVARLGWERLQAGRIDSADSLVPLYLREPAIGPQTPV
jgi:tRNA threonylcarbamoyladenosine biosynthesis protein TsaB